MIPPVATPVLLLLAAAQQAAPTAAPQALVARPAIARAAAPPSAPVVVQEPRARPRVRTPGDPHERFNRRMFATQQRFDRRFLRPAALGYKRHVPKPLRTGLRHFFSNLGEPIVFLNYLLQLKPGKAAETAARFAINSSLGIGGVLDIAKTPGVRLPHRPNGFGDTLGYYGVKPGAYLFLPLVGPTTVRDLIGGQADGLVLPLAVGTPFDRLEYQIPRAAITGLDRRAEADSDLQLLLDDAVDPYATLRSVYLQDRAGEIAALKRRKAAAAPAGELDDPLQDPAAPPAATQPPASDATELQDPLTDPATAPDPAAADPAAPARR